MAFVEMVQNARKKDSTNLISTIDPNPDYVTCQYCTRRFNENAAERHIPLCKEKSHKNWPSSSSVNASASKGTSLKLRVSYKPPTPTRKVSGKSVQ